MDAVAQTGSRVSFLSVFQVPAQHEQREGAPSDSSLMRCIGDEAEEFVARFLTERGLFIWGRNIRLGALELDIVAIDGPVVVAVEVRARGQGAFQRPLETLSKTKRTRFLRAGERLWRRYFAGDPRVERLRYDVAAVYREPHRMRIEYVRAALARSG